MFKKVFIIGLGLIGGSIASDIKDLRLAKKVAGYDIFENNLKIAESIGLIDFAMPIENLSDFDLIIISAPVGDIPEIYKKIVPSLSKRSIVIDTGSVKKYIVDEVAKIKSEASFVPCHPIAGTEKNGPNAALSGLFKNKTVVITTDDRNSDVEKIAGFWKDLGADPIFMSADRHDKIFAMMSHLPHVAAYSLVESTIEDDKMSEFMGGGMADFTRIAFSSPKMWRDIFVYNKKYVLSAIYKYEKSLCKLRTCIENQAGIMDFLSRAQTAKLLQKKNRRIIIAVDGPSGAGKSSVSREIADKLKFIYIDSGALYRAKAYIKDLDMKKLEFKKQNEKWNLFYSGKNIDGSIRSEKVGMKASDIAKDAKVRDEVNSLIYHMVGNNSAIVEGRDIGTKVFPNALLKLFLDAPIDIRAKRRKKDDCCSTKEQMEKRDTGDASRAADPLLSANDAVYIDTTASYKSVMKMISSIIRKTIPNADCKI